MKTGIKAGQAAAAADLTEKIIIYLVAPATKD